MGVRCGRCHRVLKDPSCIEVGFGRTCFKKATGKPFPGKKRASISNGGKSNIKAARPRKPREKEASANITFDDMILAEATCKHLKECVSCAGLCQRYESEE